MPHSGEKATDGMVPPLEPRPRHGADRLQLQEENEMENMTKSRAIALAALTLSVFATGCADLGTPVNNNQTEDMATVAPCVGVNTMTDVNNCGTCGHKCPVGPNFVATCDNGACNGACANGYDDCDGNTGNGCEAKLLTDTRNCGMCGVECSNVNGRGTCKAGVCQTACNPGWADCNQNNADGCEANLNADPRHCGDCATKCASVAFGKAVCDFGSCDIACNAGLENCNGSCVNTQTDKNNCGACLNSCPNGFMCLKGACSCANGQTDCGNACVNTNSDPQNCGGCGNACANGLVCSLGVCTLKCGAGLAKCGQSCVDIATDTNNCGACGKKCNFANASATCVAPQNNPTIGVCGLNTCNAGFANCDNDDANGCEVNLNTNANNCGACGNTCGNQNGVGSCIKGACALKCNPGFADCDGNSQNGCETNLNSDVNNCTACGVVCKLANAVSACNGACVVKSCSVNWGNCNNDDTDGCEANLTSDAANCGICSVTCLNGPRKSCVNKVCTASCGNNLVDGAETDVDCGGGTCAKCQVGKQCLVPNDCSSGNCLNGFCVPAASCVNVLKDQDETDVDCGGVQCSGCDIGKRCKLSGDCALKANATANCTNFVCDLGSCLSGYANCDNNKANGCEANVASDTNNCGACGKKCALANATPNCVNGACTIGQCNVGYADCDGNQANGCETNLNTDTGNCGACAARCPGNNGAATCNQGKCALACNGGFADCDGNSQNGCEANKANDANNCGACGNTCPAIANGTGGCVNSNCTTTCNAGFADCDKNQMNGCEVNLKADATNCGACAKVCGNMLVCNGGVCGIACAPGSADCDGNAGNACEINTNTDLNNCGACLNSCPTPMNASRTCGAGKCGYSCANGYADCDGNAGNGCEVNTNTDANNCSACGKACANGQICQNGVCAVPAGCNDKVKNNAETDVDCGGGVCAKCDIGKVCGNGADCLSGVCSSNVCIAPPPNGVPVICIQVPLAVVPDGGVATETVCGGDRYGKMNKGDLPVLIQGLCLGNLPSGHPENVDFDGDCGIPGPVVDASSRSMDPVKCPHNALWAGDCDDTPTGKDNKPGATDWCDNFANSCKCGPGVVNPDNDPNSCGNGKTCDGRGVCK